MQYDALVDLITADILKALEAKASLTDIAIPNMPAVLIAADNIADGSAFAIDAKKLALPCRATYASDMGNYELSQYAALILDNLSIASLVKLATGCCDTPFTDLVQRAILSGMQVIVPKQAVALFSYHQTAARNYYAMLTDKLEFLCQSGLTICEEQELADLISNLANHNMAKEQKEVAIKAEHRLITEQYIKTIAANGATCLIVNSKNIITALSRDCAKELGISLRYE